MLFGWYYQERDKERVKRWEKEEERKWKKSDMTLLNMFFRETKRTTKSLFSFIKRMGKRREQWEDEKQRRRIRRRQLLKDNRDKFQ